MKNTLKQNLNHSLLNTNKLVTALISFLFVSSAWAQLKPPSGPQRVEFTPAKQVCYDGQSNSSAPVDWRFCIHTPADGMPNGDIAYLLHGRSLDEYTWNDSAYYTAMIQKHWQDKKVSPPTVVSISFGPIWLLTKKSQLESSGLVDFFAAEVIKQVEAKTGAPKQRILFGESMGGINSLVLSMTYPNLFSKVAASCPTVYDVSPFASLQEQQAFIDRTGANPQILEGAIALAKYFIADEAEWLKFSPLKLIEKMPQHGPKFYVSSGLYDHYGNFEGNLLLAKRAKELGLPYEWHPLYGGHCATDITSLADFLVK